jgi:hypothetical protein
MKTIDVDEWLLNKQINPIEEIIKGDYGEKIFLADLLEIYLQDQFDFINKSLIQ